VTERVLVMERMPGVSYDAAAAAYGDGLQGERLLQLSIEGVLHGTLVYGRFHGDLHAGNVLIDSGDRFSLVDFGIVGRITAHERAALVRFLLGFAADDASEQLAALAEFGAIPPDADLATLRREMQQDLDAGAMRGVTFDRLGEAVGGALRLLAAHGFQLPPALVLFFKNLLYLGAFAAEVAPDADQMAGVGRAVQSYAATRSSAVSS
jgi:ubiquinone biosynthesis protein